MPVFICPGCGRRSVGDRHHGHQPRGCPECGFGFAFELLDEYYPGPTTALIVCDRERAIIAAGRGTTAITGYPERTLLGHEVGRALGLVFAAGDDPVGRCLEWGVRAQGVECTFVPAGMDEPRAATLDLFPAYDDDGGLLVALTPR